MEVKPSSSSPPPPAVAPPPTQPPPPPPPPPDPTVTVPLPPITTTTSISRPHSLYSTTTSPPLLPLPPQYPPHSLLGSILGRPPTPPLPPVGLVRPGVLPLSSIRTSPGDQMVTVATHAGYIRNAGGGGPIGVVSYPMNQTPRPFGFQSSDHVVNVQQQQQLPLISSRTQPSTQFSGSKPVVVGSMSNGMPTSSRASPAVLQPKASSLPTVPLLSDFCNRYKGLREKYRDGSVVMIYDRRVRVVDTSHSLYALCRSWVQNGLPPDSQSISGDGARLLPKPLPMSVANGDSERMDAEEDEDAYEEPKALSARDLFDGHIKRAKRIRTRLKEDRLRRINRYKQRLSLLLPLPAEQDQNSGYPKS